MTKDVSIYQPMVNFDQAVLKAIDECRRRPYNAYNIKVLFVSLDVQGWNEDTTYVYTFKCEFDGEDE